MYKLHSAKWQIEGLWNNYKRTSSDVNGSDHWLPHHLSEVTEENQENSQSG